jgi:hypothetical protein
VSGCELDSSGLGQGLVTSSCELGNESSTFIRGGEFLDLLSYYLHQKKDCALWNWLLGTWCIFLQAGTAFFMCHYTCCALKTYDVKWFLKWCPNRSNVDRHGSVIILNIRFHQNHFIHIGVIASSCTYGHTGEWE